MFCLLVDLSTRWCRKGLWSYTLESDKILLLSSSSMRAVSVHLKDEEPPFLRTLPSPRECQRVAWMLVSKVQGRDPGPDQMDQTETPNKNDQHWDRKHMRISFFPSLLQRMASDTYWSVTESYYPEKVFKVLNIPNTDLVSIQMHFYIHPIVTSYSQLTIEPKFS